MDPRGDFNLFSFDQSIRKIEDLNEGMVVPAIVTNMTKFGAFIDLGLKVSGLIHISEMSNKFIKDPSEILALREKIFARVIHVDIPRSRIMMSIKDLNYKYQHSVKIN